MKVQELIDELLRLPTNAEVMIRAPREAGQNWMQQPRIMDLDLPVIGIRFGRFVSGDKGDWAMIVGTDVWGQNAGRLK